MNDSNIDKPVIDSKEFPKTVTAGVSTILVAILNSMSQEYINVDTKENLYTVAPIIGGFVAYIWSLISSNFSTYTKEEKNHLNKLKKDIKKIKGLIKSPDKYTKEQIKELKNNLFETEVMISNFGRNSTKNNSSE